MTGRSLTFRLACAIFIEVAVMATYAPLLSIHMQRGLGFSEEQVSYVYIVRPVTSLIAPIVIGWIADRYVSAQRLFAWVSLLRAASLVFVFYARDFGWFVMAMAATSLVGWPAMTLMVAICFHHLPDSRGFGRIRVWGAVSWILAVWLVSAYVSRAPTFATQLDLLAHAFLFGALLSALLGVYAFFLPDTPPSKVGRSAFAFIDAFKLLGTRSFCVLIAASFLMALAQPFNNVLTGLFFTEPETGLGLDVAQSNFASTVAQVLELVLFPLMGTLLHRFGLRAILFIGMLAWPLRFAAYALGEPTWLVISSQLLHGFNVVFAFVGIKIAVDLMASKDIRASAQALLVMIADGAGSTLGLLLCGAVYAHYTLPGGGHAWSKIYAVPLFISLVASVVFVTLFRNRDAHEREPLPLASG